MPIASAVARASSMSCIQGQSPMTLSSLIQFFMYAPTTSWPCCLSSSAATELSTPPDMATRMRSRDMDGKETTEYTEHTEKIPSLFSNTSCPKHMDRGIAQEATEGTGARIEFSPSAPLPALKAARGLMRGPDDRSLAANAVAESSRLRWRGNCWNIVPMPDSAQRIARAWLTSASTGIIEMGEDWTAASLPLLAPGDKAFEFADLSPAEP